MTTSHWLCAVALLLLMGTSTADEHSVSEQLTRLKSQALSTQRDLGLLKRELKHSREQLLVLLSVDINTRFELVEAKLKVNGRTIKQHQFNDIEFGALRQGGNQPFANTQLAPGAYQLEIEVTAKNQNNTLFQQTEKFDFKKSEAAKVVVVHLLDNLITQQYGFGIDEWND